MPDLDGKSFPRVPIRSRFQGACRMMISVVIEKRFSPRSRCGPPESIIDNMSVQVFPKRDMRYIVLPPNPYGTNSLYSRDGATFTWIFTPPEDGFYELYMLTPHLQSTAFPSISVIQAGRRTVYINQQQGAGLWNTPSASRFLTQGLTQTFHQVSALSNQHFCGCCRF